MRERARARGAVVACALALCSACNQPWKPVTVIESLRVIGVRAEPPEVKPGQVASLEALVLDPTRPGEKLTMLWLGCEPDPYGKGRGACNDLAAVGDQTGLIDSMRLPDGVRVIGLGNRASYATRADLFDVPDAGTLIDRQKGTVGNVISLAVAADVPLTATPEELQPILDKVATKEIASQLTLFRVRVSENGTPNQNPVLDDLSVNGEVLPRGATIQLWPFIDHELDVTAHDFEEYDETLPTEVEHRTEKIVVAWYSTVGRFSVDRVSIGSEVKSKLQAPGDERTNDAIPPGRRGTLWAVARDTRGGNVWAQWPFFVCDLTRPWPVVTQVERTTSELVLHGENLDQVLDVVAEGAAVKGEYVSATRTWVGQATTGPLELRTRGCGRALVE